MKKTSKNSHVLDSVQRLTLVLQALEKQNVSISAVLIYESAQPLIKLQRAPRPGKLNGRCIGTCNKTGRRMDKYQQIIDNCRIEWLQEHDRSAL